MGWNLPPGCTQADIDRAFGGDECREPPDSCPDCFSEGECLPGCPSRIEPSLRERASVWIKRRTLPVRFRIYRLLEKMWPRKSCAVLTDDEVPF